MRITKTKSKNGQGIVEYILITALTALATIAIFRTFRADVAMAYKKAGEALIRGVDEGTSDNGGPATP